MGSDFAFHAVVMLRDSTPAAQQEVMKELEKLDCKVIYSSPAEGQLIIRCSKKRFEDEFKTKLERVPETFEGGARVPEHCWLLEPVHIPEKLRDDIAEIIIAPLPLSSTNTNGKFKIPPLPFPPFK